MRKRELHRYQKHYQEVQYPKSYKPTDVKLTVQQNLSPLQGTHSLIEQAKQELEFHLQFTSDRSSREFMQLVKALRDLVTAEVSVREEVRQSIGSLSNEQLLTQVKALLGGGVGGEGGLPSP